MELEDLCGRTYAPELHEEVSVKSIGWIGREVKATGEVPNKILGILEHLDSYHHIDDGDLGNHVCEICNDGSFHGEVWLESGEFRYVFPRALLHYINKHNYKPPAQFLLALDNFWESEKSELCKSGECEALNRNISGIERKRKFVVPKAYVPVKPWWKLW